MCIRDRSNAGLAWADVKHAEAAQFDAVAFGQGLLHALKNGLYRALGFGLGDARAVDHFVNDVKFDQAIGSRASD